MTSADRIATAVLLAAGMGSRFDASAEALPKCLLQVGGRTILERMIRALAAQGITRLIIVVGYQQELIRVAVADIAHDMQIEFLVNEQFAQSNNIVSLWRVRKAITASFLLLESDLVFAPECLEQMMRPDSIAVSELRDWMQGTRVSLDDDGTVAAFQFPPFSPGPASYKTVNIYSLSFDTWRHVVERLEHHVAQGNVHVYYEHCFSELVASGVIELQAHRFPLGQWYEVDTVEDLAEANTLFPQAQG